MKCSCFCWSFHQTQVERLVGFNMWFPAKPIGIWGKCVWNQGSARGVQGSGLAFLSVNTNRETQCWGQACSFQRFSCKALEWSAIYNVLGFFVLFLREIHGSCGVRSRDEGGIFLYLFSATSSQKHLEFMQPLITESTKECQLHAS